MKKDWIKLDSCSYGSTWQQFFCGKCKKLNWKCLGNIEDCTSTIGEEEGFVCWNCEAKNLVDTEWEWLNLDKKGNFEEPPRFEPGLKTPNY